MKYISGTQDITQKQRSIVVLGNFDGVHLGHQALFDFAKQIKDKTNLPIIAFSFHPHPTWVLGQNPKKLLSSMEDKKQKIKMSGVDTYIEYPFTKDFSNITPKQFFEDVLIAQLKAHTVIVGTNYYFGKNKTGDVLHLRMLAEKYDVDIWGIDTIKYEEQVISSTTIRQLISKGELRAVKNFLGEDYKVSGTVIHGKALGRTIGFPTANIKAKEKRVYPPNGVYATTIKVYNTNYLGITNIGYNPTVGNNAKLIETHIFDFNEDIYGEEVEVTFYDFIRPEKKFESLENLVNQIKEDTEKAKNILEEIIK